MKKVKLITSPLSSGHAVRGVGFYTKRLLPHLQRLAPEYGLEIVDSGKPDLIHYPFFDLFAPSLPLYKSCPTVVTIHDVIPLEFPSHYPPGIRGGINFFHQFISLKNTSRVITDSYASVKSIHSLLSVPHHKIKLVYLAADQVFHRIRDAKQLKLIAQKYRLPDKFVLYVGDINWNKNLPGLATACKNLHLPLVIVGRQAAELDNLPLGHPELNHLYPVKSDLVKHTLRLGFIPDEDLAAIYNLAFVYCQPSFAEGFGLPVLEAMSCGTPVVCSRTHSLPEIAGESAVYFDPGLPQTLTEALENIFQSQDLHRSLSRSGLTRSAEFSWEKTARDTLSVYRELL